MNETFRQYAEKSAKAVGSPWAFVAAVAIILIWALSGPFFHYSNTWQLIINTGTTIVTPTSAMKKAVTRKRPIF